MKVLIIDDDMETRSMLRELLEGNGYDVTEAENGEIGLRLYPQVSPDLVLTDIVMPDREGLSTIQELRKMKAKARIIAMSGGRPFSLEYLDWARKFGADRVFEKPLDLASLLLAVRDLCGPDASNPPHNS